MALLKATTRTTVGSRKAQALRAKDRIPGIIYGHGEQPIPVQLPYRDFQLAFREHKGGNAIVNLAVGGGEYTALIRDVQYDPINHHVLHLDFQHISLTEMVEVKVAVHLTGTPAGVKDGGGILEHIVREIDVRCLPTAIPPSIDIDVTGLNVGDSVHVRDLKVIDMTVLSDPDATIATVVPPTVMEEKAAEEVAVAATAAAEPEVIAKGKKDEEGAEEKPEKGKDKEKK